MSELVPPPADAPLILVADDVPANVELLFDQLHVLGFRAIAASDGPSALQVCFDKHPDLCILDVSMPGGSGLRTAADLRTQVPEARVLILSMYDNAEYVLEAVRAGASTKPLPLIHLSASR